MKTSALRILFLATMLTTLLTASPALYAAIPNLSISLTPAGPGGSTTATVNLAGVSDIESFTLTMDLSDTSIGSILSLATGSWFSLGTYLPSQPFGTIGAATPQVERNTIVASSAGTRVFFDGFKPISSARNSAGTVTLKVSPTAVVTPKASAHKITLTGEYLSKSTQMITPFSQVSTQFTVSNQPTQLLTVKIDGSGAVNSSPTGIACTSGSCSAPFPKDASIQLMETPAQNAGFSSWSGGGCSGSDPTCTVIMSADQTVTATFTLAQAVRLLTTIPAYYDFLQAAFGAATGNVTIQGRAMTLTENLTIDKGYIYTFKGGFNGDFTSQIGATTLQGKLTVGTGSLVVDRLIVR